MYHRVAGGAAIHRPEAAAYGGPMPSPEGNLTWLPLTEHLDLVAKPVAAAARLAPGAKVAQN